MTQLKGECNTTTPQFNNVPLALARKNHNSIESPCQSKGRIPSTLENEKSGPYFAETAGHVVRPGRVLIRTYWEWGGMDEVMYEHVNQSYGNIYWQNIIIYDLVFQTKKMLKNTHLNFSSS